MDTKSKIKKAVLWVLGVMFLVGGIGFIGESVISGILAILASLLLLPPTYEFMLSKTKIKIKRSIRILLIVVLIGVAGSLLPSEDVPVTINTEDEVSQTENTSSENRDQQVVENTEENVVTPTPQPKEKTYQQVFTFSGQDIKKSEPFRISGSRFKVKYNCQGELCIAWLNNTNSQFSNTLIMNSEGPLNDETIVYGSGEYYIDATSMGKWSFIVEDYR